MGRCLYTSYWQVESQCGFYQFVYSCHPLLNYFLEASDSTDHENIDSCASEYLARSQTLFSGLLPPLSKTALESQLLQFGVPSTGQTYHSALDVAKPSPRFGMLLVGNTDR